MSLPSPSAFEYDASTGLDELTRIFATQPDDVGLPLAHQAPRDDHETSRVEAPPADEDLCTLLLYPKGV